MSKNTQPTNDDTVAKLCQEVESINLSASPGQDKPAAKTIITIQIVPGTPEDQDDEDYEHEEEEDEEEEEDDPTPQEIMSNLIAYVRGLKIDGLTWSEGHEVAPIYGPLEMLTINALIVDDLVPSVDDVTDLIINSANSIVHSATVISLQKA